MQGATATSGRIRFGRTSQLEDFRLQAGSPCIDAGTLDALGLPELDFEGGPRVSGASVDIGAYEFGN